MLKIIICFNHLIFQNDNWKSFKLYKTALINSSRNGNKEIIKILLEQDGNDINAKDIKLHCLIFISNI